MHMPARHGKKLCNRLKNRTEVTTTEPSDEREFIPFPREKQISLPQEGALPRLGRRSATAGTAPALPSTAETPLVPSGQGSGLWGTRAATLPGSPALQEETHQQIPPGNKRQSNLNRPENNLVAWKMRNQNALLVCFRLIMWKTLCKVFQ